jgi:hypothetical protein
MKMHNGTTNDLAGYCLVLLAVVAAVALVLAIVDRRRAE